MPENPFDPSKQTVDAVAKNIEIEKAITELPDLVAHRLHDWMVAKLDREKTEALLHMEHKATESKKTTEDLKALVRSDQRRYEAMMNEIKAETEYKRLYEKLLSAKKLADLRTAF